MSDKITYGDVMLSDDGLRAMMRDRKDHFDVAKKVREYADVLGMDPDDVVRKFEESRTYWWPNYYQPANFPKIDDAGLEGVFDTRDAFRTFAKEHYEGFKCPFCGTVAWSPECCIHREKKDGVCDYTAGGLIGPGHSIIVKAIRLAPIPILEPVKKVS